MTTVFFLAIFRPALSFDGLHEIGNISTLIPQSIGRFEDGALESDEIFETCLADHISPEVDRGRVPVLELYLTNGMTDATLEIRQAIDDQLSHASPYYRCTTG
jgi:hypothetical protein